MNLKKQSYYLNNFISEFTNLPINFEILILLLLALYFSGCSNPLDNKQMSSRMDENLNGILSQQGDVTLSGTSFSFTAQGDIHQGSDKGNGFLTAISETKANGDLFTMSLGDITDTGSESDFSFVKQSCLDIGLELRSALGNHDIYFNGWNNFKKYFGKSIYQFNVGTVASFFVLDSANGYIGQSQFKWLTNALIASQNPVKIIVLHMPVYMGPTKSIWQLSSDEEAAQLKNLAHEYGVQLFLSGHYHGYVHHFVEGVHFVTTGGVNHKQEPGSVPHYVRVSVDVNKNISIDKIELP